MKRSPRPRALAALLTALALAAAACGGGDGGSTATEAPTATATASASEGGALVASAVASFDLAVGQDQRLMVGLFTADRELILGGDVEFELFRLDGENAVSAGTTAASFLPVPGKEPAEELSAPTVVAPADGAGVYEATVDFDQAGEWGVRVRAEVDGLGPIESTTRFVVAEEHQVVAIGEPAPRSEQPLAGDSSVPASAIDSRAQGDAEVPDAHLHDTTVADAIAAGTPTVVVVSTPTYCVSQFCGPITDTIADLADEYGDAATFVHLEVWKDFDASELNPAASEWIQTEQGGNEPWVFLVGADGNIAERWDNVLDLEELRAALDAA